jgi:hypothetical protein
MKAGETICTAHPELVRSRFLVRGGVKDLRRVRAGGGIAGFESSEGLSALAGEA